MVSPCGHPFHRDCWDQVVASHSANGGGGRGRRNRHPKCSICKGIATGGFVPVFLDLGGYDNDMCAAVGSGGGGKMPTGGVVDNIDGDDDGDVMEKMLEEWNGLWNELEALTSPTTAHGNEGDDDENDIDMTDSSSQYVANICATIDLTQNTPPRRPEDANTTMSDQSSLEMQLQQLQQKQSRVQTILQRLRVLHDEILCSQKQQQSAQMTSSSTTNNGQQLQRLKSKILNLKSTKSDLSSQNLSLQSTNDNLTKQMEQLQQTALDRTVEYERANTKRETLQSQFKSLEDSYQRYMAKSSLEKKMLNSKIQKLQGEYTKLSNKAGLQDLHEMEEIRTKYSKMTQDLHDAKLKNSRLQNEWIRREREWEARLAREEGKVGGLKKRVRMLMETVGRQQFGGATLHKGGSSSTSARNEVGSAVGNTAQQQKTSNVLQRSQKAARVGGASDVRAKAASSCYGAGACHVQQQRSSKAMEALGKAASEGKLSSQLKRPPQLQKQQQQKQQTRASDHRAKAVGTASSGNAQQRSSKASDALNSSSSRKLPIQVKRAQHDRLHQQQPRKSCDDNNTSDQVQLMMRTNSNSSKKRRVGSSSGSGVDNSQTESSGRGSSSSGASGRDRAQEQAKRPRPVSRTSSELSTSARSSASSRTLNGVSASARQKKGNISCFFKPVANA